MSLFFGRGQSEQRGMDWWGQGFDSPPASRVVTPDTATYLTPVFAAIRHIVDYATTTPVDFYRDNGDGTTSEVSAPPLFRKQDDPGKPGLGQWVGQAMYSIITDGNAVGWIVDVDAYGNPTDVLWLHRSRWNWDLTNKIWTVDGEPVPASRIVHVAWIVPPGRTLGLSPIEHFKGVVSAGLSAQEYADLKRGGGIPPSILKNSQVTLTPDEADVMKRRAVASFAKGDPFVTGADWDFTPVTLPQNIIEFVTTLKMSANQIAAVYGLEPREVGGESTGSDTLKYVNDESLELNRQANLLPYLVRLEQAFSRLMPMRQYFKFNTDARIRTDTKTRFEIYSLELQMGTRSVNEIRDLEDRPRVEGGDYFAVPKPAAPVAPEAVPIPTLPK